MMPNLEYVNYLKTKAGEPPQREAHPALKVRSFWWPLTSVESQDSSGNYFKMAIFSKLPLTMGLASIPNQSSTIAV